MLTLTQRRQEHDLAIGKFQGVVMSSNFFFVDLPKDRCFVIYHSVSPDEQSGRQALNVVDEGQLRSW